MANYVLDHTGQSVNTKLTKAENIDNKVTSISSSSTNTQYPSAKLLYDQLALKASLSSPSLTGVPTAPTASTGTNSNQIATTAFVKAAVDNLGLSGAMHFRGIDTSGNVYNGSTIGSYTINNGSSISAVSGDVLLDDDEEFVWIGSKWELLGRNTSFKITQNAITDPTASGTATSFISTISQDANGNITATKANLPTTIAGYGITDAQSKIDSNNKLSSDFVTDTNNTNKFVTVSEKTTWNGKYSKPSDGIPKIDLASDVQTSLGKADTALQSYTEQYTGTITGITMNGVSKGTSGIIDLGTVLTQHQDISGKANISDIPTKVSDIQNDSGFITGREDYCFSLPPIIYTGLNGETKIYSRNIFTPNYLLYWGSYTNSTIIRDYDDYISLVGTAAATKNVGWRVFDRGYRMIEDGSTRVQIKATVPASQTMLLIGDSFISQNCIGPDLQALFTADNHTLTLIGTKGTSPKNHEGYAGFKYTDFTSSDRASTTAFWNSSTEKFDFSHYMTTNGYSTLNSVYIQLGTNDVSASSIQDNFTDVIAAAREMITSILTYNSNIKIYLGLTVMPTLISENFAAKYNGVGTSWIMRYNMQRLNAALISEFSANNAIKIVATNCILDSTKDISDNVHPTKVGYQKIAQQLYYTMMS